MKGLQKPMKKTKKPKRLDSTNYREDGLPFLDPPDPPKRRRKMFEFVALPVELRERVFLYLMPQERHITLNDIKEYLSNAGEDKVRRSYPGILSTRREVAQEAFPVWLNRNTINIDGWTKEEVLFVDKALMDRSLPGPLVKHVRIAIATIPREDDLRRQISLHNTFTVLQRCHTLTCVRLYFMADITNFGLMEMKRRCNMVETLESLKKLKKIEFGLAAPVGQDQTNDIKAVDKIHAWLMKKMETQKPNVEMAQRYWAIY